MSLLSSLLFGFPLTTSSLEPKLAAAATTVTALVILAVTAMAPKTRSVIATVLEIPAVVAMDPRTPAMTATAQAILAVIAMVPRTPAMTATAQAILAVIAMVPRTPAMTVTAQAILVVIAMVPRTPAATPTAQAIPAVVQGMTAMDLGASLVAAMATTTVCDYPAITSPQQAEVEITLLIIVIMQHLPKIRS